MTKRDAATAMVDRVYKLEAENERLVSALRKIADCQSADANMLTLMARAALDGRVASLYGNCATKVQNK